MFKKGMFKNVDDRSYSVEAESEYENHEKEKINPIINFEKLQINLNQRKDKTHENDISFQLLNPSPKNDKSSSNMIKIYSGKNDINFLQPKTSLFECLWQIF